MSDIQKSKLIVMVGLQGSGKSYIAYELSRRLKIPVFSVDPIHSAILAAGIEESFAVGYADYLIAEKLAEENLKNNIPVIIDASNFVKESHKIWENLSERVNVHLVVIESILEPIEHKRRIEKRVRNISGIKEVSWQDVEKRIEESIEWEIDKLVLDTSIKKSENIQIAIDYINNKCAK